MPQATGAQREPSMEEILASIRRIIEDSDTTKKHPSDDESVPSAGSGVRSEVDAFRAELRAAPEPVRAAAPRSEPVRQEPPRFEAPRFDEPRFEAPRFEAPRFEAPRVEAPRLDPPKIETAVAEAPKVDPAKAVTPASETSERKPISLAEVQAEMRRTLPPLASAANDPVPPYRPNGLSEPRASVAGEKPVSPDERPETRKPVSMADIQALLDKEPAPLVDLVDPIDDAVETPAARNSEGDVSPPRPLDRLASLQPAAQGPVEPSGVAQPPKLAEIPRLVAAQAAPSRPEADSQQPKPSIISAAAGRQVAAAFGELSEAFAASRQKTFDDMAEQMMRPMLQEWMDNNLPMLVERLVREEIERVARGA